MLNQTLNDLKLEKQPDKNLIGRTKCGFSSLGYQFNPDRLTVGSKTLEQFVERSRQLYEQEPGEEAFSRIGVYIRRWIRYVTSGLTASVTLPVIFKSLALSLRRYCITYANGLNNYDGCQIEFVKINYGYPPAVIIGTEGLARRYE